jgi:tRNA (guanine-N7-)-methyltransferase
MARRKLLRFDHNAQATNIIEPGKEIFEKIKGNWRNDYFKNQNPIVLELACGRGEYTTGLAAVFPHKNFVGVDIKGARIWKGSTVAIEQGLQNVAFLRIHIQNLTQYFAEGEVNEIWITFPDPRPKTFDRHRRLTHPRFLAMYQHLLGESGIVHLKTDNEPFFDFTMETLREQSIQDLIFTKDLYNAPLNAEHYGISTTYEKKFTTQGFKINYLRFKFR